MNGVKLINVDQEIRITCTPKPIYVVFVKHQEPLETKQQSNVTLTCGSHFQTIDKLNASGL